MLISDKEVVKNIKRTDLSIIAKTTAKKHREEFFTALLGMFFKD